MNKLQVVPGVAITVGQDKDDGGRWPYAGTAGAVEQMGAKHVNRDVHISFHQSFLCNPSVALIGSYVPGCPFSTEISLQNSILPNFLFSKRARS